MMAWVRLIALLLFFAGCVVSPPKTEVTLLKFDSLSQLEGIYKNQGEGDTEWANRLYLSQLIWPNDSNLDHPNVVLINVRMVTDQAFEVSALDSQENTVKSTIFTEGKEFTVENGKIVLLDEKGLVGSKADEPMIGMYTEKRYLSVDTRGDGKMRTEGGAVGMVFMLIPAVVSGSDEVTFPRIETPNQ